MSFVNVPPKSHFSLENLPYGIFRPKPGASPRVGVAIGEHILDLAALADAGLLDAALLDDLSCFHQRALNDFLSMGRPAWKKTRAVVKKLLSADDPTLRDNQALRAKALHHQSNAVMELPAAIGDYTDFYSSLHHATNVGTLFRGKDNPLPANWKHVPIGYHGRASSIVVSGTNIRRPWGQVAPSQGSTTPGFSACQILDFELEMAALAGPGNDLGVPVNIENALDHVFGLVLMNDWSARDIQKWEYVPLGPFLSKSFGTSISPWVVTLEALEPFLCEAPKQDPEPLPYLREPQRQTYDISLEVAIKPRGATDGSTVCQTNFKHLYWTLAQQVAHHTVNGCNLRPGDLLGSGTISGPEETSRACLLERSWGGTREVNLDNGGRSRKFLEDGDEVILSGFCQGDGFRVGFGECTGKIVPSGS